MRSTAFEQLGLYPNASRREVERAWRRYVFRHHPDRGGDTEAFVRGQLAYETIRQRLNFRQYVAQRLAHHDHSQNAAAVAAMDASLSIPVGYRFAVGVLAALLQFIFIWTRIMAAGGLVFIFASPFYPIPQDQLWYFSLIGGIGFTGLALEFFSLPGRIRKRLEGIYACRGLVRRLSWLLGQTEGVDSHPKAQQYGGLVFSLVLFTVFILWISLDVLLDPTESNLQLLFNPFFVGYGGFWFWWTWIHNERRARRLRPWFIGGMVTAFFLMIHFLG